MSKNNIKKLLIVDDDQESAENLANILRIRQFDCTVILNNDKVLEELKNNHYDLVLLDFMFPNGKDGIDVCSEIRNISNIPVILMTAHSQIVTTSDTVVALRIGADDFLMKPLDIQELVARIEARLRRFSEYPKDDDKIENVIFLFEGHALNTVSMTLTSKDSNVPIKLSSSDFQLLYIFLTNPQVVLSRDTLVEKLHNRNRDIYDRAIDVRISILRKKIEKNPNNPKIIRTIYNQGYKFTAQVTTKSLEE